MTADTTTPTAAETSFLHPVRRGVITASVGIGFWSMLVFWWYPYSVFIATVGLVLGLIARISGWRAEAYGSNLASVGIALNLITLGTTAAVFRAMQFFFEGQMALMPPSWLAHWFGLTR